MHTVNLADKFAHFNDHWNPRIAGELNGQQVKLVKLLGAFDWHHHDNEDELFLVVKGVLTMRLRDGDLMVREFLIVPAGIEHQPFAEQEVHVVLFEPASTLNTGTVTSERSRAVLERV